MSGWPQEARFALRILGKERWTTLVIVGILAMGIGANATVFTLAHAVLFKAMPIEEGDRFFAIAGRNLARGEDRIPLSWRELEDLRERHSFEGVAGLRQAVLNLSSDGHPPERISGAYITPDLFPLLRMKPVLGSGMSAADGKAGAPRTALLSYGAWKSRYGGDASILGKAVRIDGHPATVIGVMPDGFQFPSNQQIWISFQPGVYDERRDYRTLYVFGRLAPGATAARARAEVDLLAQRLQQQFPETNRAIGMRVMTLRELLSGGAVQSALLALLGAVGFVLLIACANVASLQIARAMSRTREISVRLALGASHWRVIRQLLVENVLLALLACLPGLGLAIFGVRAFDAATAETGRPYWVQFSFEPAVFAYMAFVCLLTGVLAGLAPALQLAKVDLNETLKDGSRGNTGGRRRWLSHSLVVMEVALATVLLTSAGLMIRSFLEAYKMSGEINAAQLLSARITLNEDKYSSMAVRSSFHNQLRERLQSVPGIRAAALVSHEPYGGAFGWRYEIEARPVPAGERAPTVEGIRVTPEYFRVMNLRLARGREFEETDGAEGKLAAIVNRAFAVKHWPGEDPIGKRFRKLPDSPAANLTLPPAWISVVGVAPDIDQSPSERRDPDPLIYLPMREEPQRYFSVLASSNLTAAALAPGIRTAVEEVDPYLPTSRLQTMEEILARQRWPSRVFGTLFTVFAVIALVLAAVGIFGVMACTVSQRTTEIGLRIALGADEQSILRMLLGGGLWQIGIGLSLGVVAALAAVRTLASLMTRVSPADPITLLSVVLILAVAGLAACWVPARRALRVDPLTALRHD